MKFSLSLFLFVFLFTFSGVQAQREAANWYFGLKAGLDFNSGIPESQVGQLQTIEGSATISDRNGNLLFYTDGVTVYDRQHNPMPNGFGLKGNVSSSQSAIIVPKPGNSGQYYIFTVDLPDYSLRADDPIEGVNYSLVDMSLNSGYGDIVTSEKNIHLITYNQQDPIENKYKSSEKISAVLHEDGSSYWVVTQFVNRIYSFKVTAAGVDTSPAVSTTPTSAPPTINEQGVNITAIGYLKISPDGKKLAVAFSSTRLGSERTGNKRSGKVFLYDFNDATGRVSNEQLLLFDSYPYGVEFSPRTTKLYVTANVYDERDVLLRSELYQYNLESSNILASRTTVHSSNNVAGALQLAIDGRIYRAGYPIFSQTHGFLSVIKNPEAIGQEVNYSHNTISVAPQVVQLGLPPFIQSLFLNNFNFENLCFGDATHFFVTSGEPYTSLVWDFGDGNTSTEDEPLHTFSAPGSYVVSLTRILNGETFEPARKEIIIVEIPEVQDRFELVQCDTDDDPEDGLTTFNLQQAREGVTLGNSNTQVFFYENRASAEDDELNQNALNNVYRNTSPNQVIFAKVTGFNSECSGISEVELSTKNSIALNPEPAYRCDTGNGEAEFNFENIETKILAELNLSADVELTFHVSKNDAAVAINPLPEFYTSAPGTVYINATSNGLCYGAGELELRTIAFPEVMSRYELQACATQFPVTLGSELIFNDGQFYKFTWSTGESSREIQVNNGGSYFVEISNANIGCGRTVEYFIEELITPEIIDIEVVNNGATSEITVIPSIVEGSLYAIDDINGPYQESPVFSNVTGGSHIIYLKNDEACEIEQQEVTVFGFPKFFSPNNDSYNDRWIPGKTSDENFRIENIFIYDRYGKLLKELDPRGSGWDGTFNNRPMPEDDYWFHIRLSNGSEIKGHFSLVR